MPDNQTRLTWKDLFDIASPVAVRLVNDVIAYHENESIQALALLAAGAILSKDSGLVTRDEYLTACALLWDTSTAEFETVAVN